jgi:hypothetical protein
MLFLTLPEGVEAGEVRINGQKAEARLDRAAGTLAFRYLDGADGPGPWDVRRVMGTVSTAEDRTSYVCSNGAD